MSLTKNDLKSIQQVVLTTVQPMIDGVKTELRDEIDKLATDTAAGFAEVHNKIDTVKTDLDIVKTDLDIVKTDLDIVKTDLDSVKDTVGRIELVQRAEVARADEHGDKIKKLQHKLA